MCAQISRTLILAVKFISLALPSYKIQIENHLMTTDKGQLTTDIERSRSIRKPLFTFQYIFYFFLELFIIYRFHAVFAHTQTY